jgi:hypothetical protein
MAANKTTQIRKTVKNVWEFWSMYNDKRNNGTRRLKFMRNGATITQMSQQVIQFAVKRDLQAQGIAVVSVQWNVGERMGYGVYDYLEIVY